MHHFFVPSDAIQGNQVSFPEQTGRQIQRVLRLNAGESVIALDNSGKMYESVLAFDEKKVTGAIIETRDAGTEPLIKIRLLACVSQREKYEWILQKGTELGVSEFLPVISQRTLVQKSAAIDKKRSRWETIIQEAAEQSHRGKLPVLMDVVKYDDLIKQVDSDACNLIAHISDEMNSLKSVLKVNDKLTFNLLVGPEGGFSDEEVSAAVQVGFQSVSLGARILRMETAALAIVNSVLFYSSSSD